MIYILVVVVVAVWLIIKAFRFIQKGGSFTLVTTNTSYLYYQAKNVYPKLREDVVRYVAILINSSSNRNYFTEDKIKRLVLLHSSQNWSSLCSEYTWEYSTSCGGPKRASIAQDIVMAYNDKIAKVILEVEKKVRSGKIRADCEIALRRMDQAEVMALILKMDNG